ncbi:DUF2935 domain-containing protein [Mediterraneibacter gnavus]|uniref:DUF2935 domain-containing protein n=1 Tax=Mediterraneibacter gnavus TaxID=33038 RepID=UPI00232BC2E2|nr:DUF2935 domain-containing protein [Mediterraneibacter gnavus]MDB8709719.1 DUF2935 domain-containing protein [Mediterraneibacter gnavus]MDB8712485.1 DUF2935 domain-containing protein [Mediterraneibacter gnavus]
MKEYVTTSLETHLFFGRIMKEHALFLEAAFPAGEMAYRRKADWFREQFENAMERTVWLANGMVSEAVLHSGEVFTEFTEMAEQQTSKLTKIPINVRITQAEKNLRAGRGICPDRRMVQNVRQLNQHILQLLNGLIAFKEKILQEVTSCDLYTANYPLLIEHILREAKLYRQIMTALEENSCMPFQDLKEAEMFWNQIMMEHALFIRGLLDPTECELIETADTFAGDYCRLLEAARTQDCRAMDEVTRKTLETTEQYRDFKAAGTEGITGCGIRSVILPLLADHVLREANHYLRILKTEKEGINNGIMSISLSKEDTVFYDRSNPDSDRI